MLNLKQLLVFDAVVREGGFAKAAGRLGVSQPAITAQIKALEERYGVALFRRHGKRVTLTDIGTRLTSLGRQVSVLGEEAEDLLVSAARLRVGVLRIAAGSPYLAAALLDRFRKRFLGVEIHLSAGNYEEIRARLLAEEVDVAIQTEAAAEPLIERFAMARQNLVVFGTVDAFSELAPATGAVALARLANASLILREPASVTRRLFDRLCDEHDVAARPAIQAASRESVFELVARGLGLGIVLEGELPRDARIVTRPILEAGAPLTDYLLCLKHRKGLRMIREVLALALPIPSD